MRSAEIFDRGEPYPFTDRPFDGKIRARLADDDRHSIEGHTSFCVKLLQRATPVIGGGLTLAPIRQDVRAPGRSSNTTASGQGATLAADVDVDQQN